MVELTLGRHGAMTREAAIRSFGGYQVRKSQELGIWTAPWPGVVVEASRAADPLTMAAAAVALGGPDVMLAGPTAAHLHGCTAAEFLPAHLITPYGHPLRTRPGLMVHNGPLPEADRTVVLGLPVLGFHRVLTDILCTSTPPDALAVLDQALALVEPVRRETFRAAIAKRLAARRDPRGTRRGAQLLGLGTGRAESPAESRLLWRIVDSGFPVPEVNWSLTGPTGREVYRLDLAWPDLRIAIEYHGYAVHVERSAEDAARADDLRRRGWILIEVWADDLARPGGYEGELDAAFRRRGVDTSRRCLGVLRGRTHREAQRRDGTRRSGLRRGA